MARLKFVPENVLERAAFMMNMFPRPLGESFFTLILARTIMAATRFGVFEVLEGKALSAEDVAEQCGLEASATERMLRALQSCGYLRYRSGLFELLPPARWALESHPQSAKDKILCHYMEWEFLTNLEEYVQTGQEISIHDTMDDEQWGIYQRGMRSSQAAFAEEVAKRLKLPPNPTSMLDIGGSHGYFSVCFCRAHDSLQATVLELPEAIEAAAPLLAEAGLGDRVQHRAANALEDDLGDGEHDLVLIANLVHHFSEEQNAELVKRAARSLKPGGVVAIFEQIRVGPEKVPSQIAGLLDLYFGLTSYAGTWTEAELRGFITDAGLKPRKMMRMRAVRDLGVVSGVKQ